MTEPAAVPASAEAVLDFWFREIDPKLWFARDEDFDRQLAKRFATAVEHALAGGLQSWEDRPESRLALILLLDQFTRNLHRGTAGAFSGDQRALALTLDAMARGWDGLLPLPERKFLYMPLMHAEDAAIQEKSVAAFTALGEEDSLNYAILHKRIIDRFGRYPHRNTALGRPSTPEEEAFLLEPNSSF